MQKNLTPVQLSQIIGTNTSTLLIIINSERFGQY